MAEDIRVPAEIIRSERFELVGRDGKTRAVLGRIGDHDGQGFYGLSLLDDTGTRVEIMTGPEGPSVSLVQGENGRVVVTIEEGHESLVPGPKILVCEPDGRPVVRLQVEDDVPET